MEGEPRTVGARGLVADAAMPTLSRRAGRWLRAATRPADPLVRAARLWSDADGGRMSAAMSFYGVLSLAPLLLLLVAALGWWVDRAMLESRLAGEIATILGPQGRSLIEHALSSARQPREGVIASTAGLIVLLTGATGVFGELQAAFERVWASGSATVPAQRWWHGTSLRLRGIGYILAFGFLLLVSLVISTLLNLASSWAGAQFALAQGVRVLSETLAFGICVALFFGLMRMSGGAKPRPSSLLLGALVGAALFTAGRQVLAVYLSSAAVVSAYGAAGSLVVLLIWIYFSSAVLLFGAASAKAVEEQHSAREARRVPPPAAAPLPP
jgi:membrane protein